MHWETSFIIFIIFSISTASGLMLYNIIKNTIATITANEERYRTLYNTMAEGVVHLGAARTEEQLGKPVLKIEVELRQASGKPSRHALRVGAGDSWRDTSVFYVRRDGTDATYAVAQARLFTGPEPFAAG